MGGAMNPTSLRLLPWLARAGVLLAVFGWAPDAFG